MMWQWDPHIKLFKTTQVANAGARPVLERHARKEDIHGMKIHARAAVLHLPVVHPANQASPGILEDVNVSVLNNLQRAPEECFGTNPYVNVPAV